jgi:hypothetical protein
MKNNYIKATVYDADDNEMKIKCEKCDKPAFWIYLGQDEGIGFCLDHRPELKLTGELRERPAVLPDSWEVKRK